MLDRLICRAFPENDPTVTGKTLYALPSGKLFWVPDPKRDSEGYHKAIKEMGGSGMGIRMAGDEPWTNVLDLLLNTYSFPKIMWHIIRGKPLNV